MSFLWVSFQRRNDKIRGNNRNKVKEGTRKIGVAKDVADFATMKSPTYTLLFRSLSSLQHRVRSHDLTRSIHVEMLVRVLNSCCDAIRYDDYRYSALVVL